MINLPPHQSRTVYLVFDNIVASLRRVILEEVLDAEGSNFDRRCC